MPWNEAVTLHKLHVQLWPLILKKNFVFKVQNNFFQDPVSKIDPLSKNIKKASGFEFLLFLNLFTEMRNFKCSKIFCFVEPLEFKTVRLCYGIESIMSGFQNFKFFNFK